MNDGCFITVTIIFNLLFGKYGTVAHWQNVNESKLKLDTQISTNYSGYSANHGSVGNNAL